MERRNMKLADRLKTQSSRFSHIKNLYCEMGMTFELFYMGSVVNIIFENKKKRFGSIPVKQGMFLSKITNKVVENRIKTGLYVPINTDPMRTRNKTIKYSSDNIKRNLLKPCVAVDIVGCYWQTAFNLGVIDEKTYLLGISKDREYKDARNISIGSIGALITHEKYVEGKLMSVERTRKIGACARLDIIDSVWEMSERIASKLGPNFLMYLTDCFFVPADQKELVCKLIADEGYKSKCEQIEFGEINRMHEGKNKSGETIFTEQVVWYVVEQDKVKFHDFSNIHNVNFK